MANEFPKALYKGADYGQDGADTCIVTTKDDLQAHLTEGWRETPNQQPNAPDPPEEKPAPSPSPSRAKREKE